MICEHLKQQVFCCLGSCFGQFWCIILAPVKFSGLILLLRVGKR